MAWRPRDKDTGRLARDVAALTKETPTLASRAAPVARLTPEQRHGGRDAGAGRAAVQDRRAVRGPAGPLRALARRDRRL